MFGMFQTLHFFLLQDRVKYFKDDNPMEGVILLIAVAVVVGGALLFHVIRNAFGGSVPGPGKSRGGAAATPRKFNAFTLHRIASAYGLDRDQTRLLEFVFRNDSVADPERAMKSPALLDRHFKRAYKSIEKTSETEEDTQQRLVKLFSLRNIIEAAPGGDDPPSGRISENTPAVLVIDNESYPVKVIASRAQNVLTEIPRNALGTPVRLSKGMKVTLSFFTKSSKGFSLEGQITGSQETENGPALLISHSGKTKPLVKRKYRRKQTTIRCAFFLVHLDDSDSGRKKAPKLVVDNKRFVGNVLDVSIGGCSIKTVSPVQVGSRLKISIDYDENFVINVLGQVLRINRSGPSGAMIVHIKFLKVPRRAFNSISALVFGFDE